MLRNIATVDPNALPRLHLFEVSVEPLELPFDPVGGWVPLGDAGLLIRPLSAAISSSELCCNARADHVELPTVGSEDVSPPVSVPAGVWPIVPSAPGVTVSDDVTVLWPESATWFGVPTTLPS